MAEARAADPPYQSVVASRWLADAALQRDAGEGHRFLSTRRCAQSEISASLSDLSLTRRSAEAVSELKT